MPFWQSRNGFQRISYIRNYRSMMTISLRCAGCTFGRLNGVERFLVAGRRRVEQHQAEQVIRRSCYSCLKHKEGASPTSICICDRPRTSQLIGFFFPLLFLLFFLFFLFSCSVEKSSAPVESVVPIWRSFFFFSVCLCVCVCVCWKLIVTC